MPFYRALFRLARLLLGKDLNPSRPSILSLNLALLDHIPLLKRLASRHFFRAARTFLPPPETPVHTLCIGRSGSGKSEALKLLALAEKTSSTWRGTRRIRRDRSLILIDPHGQLAEELARQNVYQHDHHQHPNNPDLIYLDPCLALNHGYSPSINPFDLYGAHHSDIKREKSVQQLTAVLRSLTCKNDETLSTNMETLLYPCLSVLLARPGSTLPDLLRFLHTTGNQDLLTLGLRSSNDAHRYFFQHSFDHPRFAPTRGAISTKIQSLLNSQAFAAFLGSPHSTLNLEQAINSGKTIIINCAAGQLGQHTMSAIGRFIIAMVLAVAFNRSPSTAFRHPIRLVIDEMQHFVSDELITILTEARKYGLHLTLASQIVGQAMSPHLTKTILGNTALKLLGDAGADSRRIMAKEMGINTKAADSLQVGQFLIRHQHEPPLRCRFPNAHIGHRHTMNPKQWQSLKQHQIKRWYPHITGPGPPQNRPDPPIAPIRPDTLQDFDSSPPPS